MFYKKTIRSCHGFTLVELLLVMAMLGTVAIAVYGTIANGINIWQRVVVETAAEDVGIFFERITEEMRNTFLLGEVKFRGGRDSVRFPALIRSAGKEGIKTEIGEVRYTFDRRNKTIARGQRTYSQIYRDRDNLSRTIAENIESIQFEYYTYKQERKKYSWESKWQEQDETFGEQQKPSLPLAVRIQVEIKERGKPRTIIRTIWIPNGCCAGSEA